MSLTPQTNGADIAREPRRILVVDDNRDSAELLARVLRHRGHVVRTAFCGVTALALCREFHPEVILLDIGLPRRGGLEVAAEVRESHECSGSVIVGVSGYSPEMLPRDPRTAGFDHYLIKPVELDAITRIIE